MGLGWFGSRFVWVYVGLGLGSAILYPFVVTHVLKLMISSEYGLVRVAVLVDFDTFPLY